MKSKKIFLGILSSLLATCSIATISIPIVSCSYEDPPIIPSYNPTLDYETKDGRFLVRGNALKQWLTPVEERGWDLVIPEKVEVNDGYHKVEIKEIWGGFLRILNEPYFYKIESILLPNTLEKIGPEAFKGNNIKKLIIPNSVKIIGEEAFFKNQISTLEISDGLESISNGCFEDNNISNVESLKNVKVIGEQAFWKNNFLDLNFLRNCRVEELGRYSFRNRNGNNVAKIILPPNLNKIGIGALTVARNTVKKELKKPNPNLESLIDLNGVDWRNLEYIDTNGCNGWKPQNLEEFIKFIVDYDGW